MEKEKNEKEEKKPQSKKETLKNILNSKRGRAILFFIFYILFFTILILFLRNYNSDTNNKKHSSSIKENYNLNKIETGNYRFTLRENINEQITTFQGETNNDRSAVLMTKNDQVKTLFMYGGIILEKEGSVNKVVINPYLYPKLKEYRYIEDILETATLKSKTVYQQGDTIYQYEITTTSLVAILNEKEVDLDMPSNIVEVKVNDKFDITAITYLINSYHKYERNEDANAIIEIEYYDYGKVKNLEIPE